MDFKPIDKLVNIVKILWVYRFWIWMAGMELGAQHAFDSNPRDPTYWYDFSLWCHGQAKRRHAGAR